jgi:hypothetical protein
MGVLEEENVELRQRKKDVEGSQKERDFQKERKQNGSCQASCLLFLHIK